jgi:hypothetical protein
VREEGTTREAGVRSRQVSGGAWKLGFEKLYGFSSAREIPATRLGSKGASLGNLTFAGMLRILLVLLTTTLRTSCTSQMKTSLYIDLLPTSCHGADPATITV